MVIFRNNSTTVFQSRLYQLNTTVIQMEDLILVVDPGFLPDEIENIQTYVEKIKGDRPVYLFFTHSDFDHIAGYGAFPEARTIGSKEFVESSQQQKQLEDLQNVDEEFYLTRPYDLEYPGIDYVIEEDGERMIVGQTAITFHHAFGHNHDGLIAIVGNTVIAGDYLSDIEFPFVYHSFSEYNQTLETLKHIFRTMPNPVLLITSHGTVTDDAVSIDQRIQDSEDYFSLLKKNPDERVFNHYLSDKGYVFKHLFWRRHQENLQMWNAKQ